MKLTGGNIMVVRSATKKYLIDLGLPEPIANELAVDTRLKELHLLTADRFINVVTDYHIHNTSLGNLEANMALWYGLIVHYPMYSVKKRHKPSFINERKWSWGVVTGGTLPLTQKKHMTDLMNKYHQILESSVIMNAGHGTIHQIAINWTRYLNKIKCGGCQKLWKPDKMDVYGETCPGCQAAYSGDIGYMDSIQSFDELAK